MMNVKKKADMNKKMEMKYFLDYKNENENKSK